MAGKPAPRQFLTALALGALALAGGLPGSAAEKPAVAAATAVSSGPTLVAARLLGDQKRSRFVADLTATAEASVFTLPDPYRIVVDLPGVGFRLPDNAGLEGRGLFTAFRYGQISPGRSRIVLDLTGPAKLDKSFVVPPADGQPARLVIDVVPTSRAAFLETSRAYRESQSLAETARRDRMLTAPGADQKTGRPVVVVDPGHGGIDNGARSRSGTIEKDVTLAFSKVLAERLEKTGLYDVLLTRNDDSFVALGDRMAFARAHHARLFVSVHANSFGGNSVRGAIIYTISEDASDRMAAEVAKSENQSDALAGLDIAEDDSDDVKDILLDLTRRETRNFGVVFARNLVKEMKSTTRMFKIPHQTASFKVLEAHDVPSAMIELGFVSNAEDEKLLLSEEWRGKSADSVVRAIGAYFETQLAQQGGQ